MNDHGYTLVEMLVALTIIALAFGGLSESAQVLGRLQSSALHVSADATLRARSQRELGRLLEDAGPFVSTAPRSFVGTSTSFSFPCGANAVCSAQISQAATKSLLVTTKPGAPQASIILPAGAEFRYGDAGGEGDAWPSSASQPTELRTVSLLGDHGFPIATLRLAIDEPADCVFDMVSQSCRISP